MHLQINSSPGTTAENVRTVVDALAKAGVNVEAIGPDFNPPHVRVLVGHKPDYKKDDGTDEFNKARSALKGATLDPRSVRAIKPVTIPHRSGALKAAMDEIEAAGHTIESILVLPGGQGNSVRISFGVDGDVDDTWDAKSSALSDRVQKRLAQL